MASGRAGQASITACRSGDSWMRSATLCATLSRSIAVTCRLACASGELRTVFKTVGSCVKRLSGGFDSHALPPFFFAWCRNASRHFAQLRLTPGTCVSCHRHFASRCDLERVRAALDFAPQVRRFLRRPPEPARNALRSFGDNASERPVGCCPSICKRRATGTSLQVPFAGSTASCGRCAATVPCRLASQAVSCVCGDSILGHDIA